MRNPMMALGFPRMDADFGSNDSFTHFPSLPIPTDRLRQAPGT